VRARKITVATWNLSWLTLRHQPDPLLPPGLRTRDAEDFARLRAYADLLGADIMGLEEVDGVAAVARVFDPARYEILTLAEPVIQQVGIAVRRGFAVTRNPEVMALDVEPLAAHRLRAGLDVTVAPPHAPALRVLVVHLKAGCHDDPLALSPRPACRVLARQIPPLIAWARMRAGEGVPFLILGDFNRVMDPPEELATALAPYTLRATAGYADPCWGGEDFIDHIFLGGPARAWLVPGSLHVETYRERGRLWRERLSDHCPVAVRLNLPDLP
jgi:endonuclease/exonuclease/phosphatase family metal-dependent hydrolase